MCGMTNTTGSGEGKPMAETLESIVAQIILEGMAAGKALEADLEGHVTVNAIHCPYCGTNSPTIEAATVHDGECEKHPMAVQLSAALRREEVLREALKNLTECFEVWSTLPDPTEWPIKPSYGLLVTVRKAINALSACDEGGGSDHAAD